MRVGVELVIQNRFDIIQPTINIIFNIKKMLRLSVDSKYDSAKVLKELPRNQLVGLKKNYDEGSTL